MINYFKEVCATKQSITPVIINGQEWQRFYVSRFDDMEGKAGGSPRAQIHQAEVGLPLGNHKINFDLMIPKDWKVRPEYVNVHDIHTRHASPSGQSFNMYIRNQQFYCTFPKPKIDGKLVGNYAEFTFGWTPGIVYQFRCSIQMSQEGVSEKKGFYKMIVNGQEKFRHFGHMFRDGEKEIGPYWKLGPYIGQRSFEDSNWPEDVDYRELFIRV